MRQTAIEFVRVDEIIHDGPRRTKVKEVDRKPFCGPHKVHINNDQCWPEGTMVTVSQSD